MTGSQNNFKYRGIIPRAIAQVYHEISSKFDQAVTIRASYVEIYNEMMFDLLNAEIPTYQQNASNLQIQDDSRGGV
jgi:kinesin family protein 6/9